METQGLPVRLLYTATGWDSFSFEPSIEDPVGNYTYDLTLFWGGPDHLDANITVQYTFEVQFKPIEPVDPYD